MAEVEIVDNLRPNRGKPTAREESLTSSREQKNKKEVPVEQPKLTDIPSYMDALSWNVSAKLMRKWFSGDAYKIENDEKTGKTPPSQYAQKSPRRNQLIDTDTIKISWLLSFDRAKKVFNEGLYRKSSNRYEFYSQNVRKRIINLIKRDNLFTNKPEKFGDLSKPPIWQHEHWQITYSKVDAGIIDKTQRNIEGLDDLYGALGVFAFYVAAAGTITPKVPDTPKLLGATIKQDKDTPHKQPPSLYIIEIKTIGIYVRDTYGIRTTLTATNILAIGTNTELKYLKDLPFPISYHC